VILCKLLPFDREGRSHQASFFRQMGATTMAKHTKITIETDSLLVLRGRSSLRGWCPRCAAEGEMIRLDNIGVISNLEPSEVEAWLESEVIHRSRGSDGSPLICLNSLLRRVHKTKTA
jgi:hypothetical protein